jgi:CBS domain-containing protein
VDVQRREVGFLLVGEGAERLRELVLEDALVAGTAVVDAALLFAVPAHRDAASLGDRQREVADRLVAIVGRRDGRRDVAGGRSRSDVLNRRSARQQRAPWWGRG